MKVFRVLVTMTTDLYVDVRAATREEALERAEDIDGGVFKEDGPGGWDVYDAVEIAENEIKNLAE